MAVVATPAAAPLTHKKRFSIDAIKRPFRLRKTSVTSVVTPPQGDPVVPRRSTSKRSIHNTTDDEEQEDDGAEEEQDSDDDGSEIVPFSIASSPYRPAASASSPALVMGGQYRRTPNPDRRVSFSPSTDDALTAREEALALLTEQRELSGVGADGEPLGGNGAGIESDGSKAAKALVLERRKLQKERARVEKRERKKKDKEDKERRAMAAAVSATATGSAADAKSAHGHANFVWEDGKIKESKDKGRPARAKVSKQQAVAARHARLLEHVINGGTGASHVSAQSGPHTSPSSASGHHPRARVVPLATPKELKGLKSALLDVDLANGIIGELRGMAIPVSGAAIEQHGRDRIVSTKTSSPDSAVDASQSLSNTSVNETPAAAASAQPHRLTRSRSQAELALTRLSTEQDAARAQAASPSSKPKFALPDLRRRLSSNASSSKGAAEAAHAAIAPIAARPHPAVQPKVKAVCLDCTEMHAHVRHFKHHAKAQREAWQKTEEPKQNDAQAASPSSPLSKAFSAVQSLLPSSTAPVAKAATPLEEDTIAEAASVVAEDVAAAEVEAAPIAVVGEEAIVAATATPVAPAMGVAAVGAAAVFGISAWWHSQKGTEPAASTTGLSVDVKASGEKAEDDELFSVAGYSLNNLPELPTGPTLMGVSAVSLIFSPQSTLISATGERSGAFDALAAVTTAAIKASGTSDGLRPPLDRLGIFVHWWGFEITMPAASMAYLGTAQSVSGAFMSFLQTMAVSGGVPELIPFIRYISMYMDVEFKAVQAQDQGDGVVVAATWFMPLALVPRPWDYPTTPEEGAPAPPATLPTPAPAPAPAPSPAPAPAPPVSAPTESAPIFMPVAAPPTNLPTLYTTEPHPSVATASPNLRASAFPAPLGAGARATSRSRSSSPVPSLRSLSGVSAGGSSRSGRASPSPPRTPSTSGFVSADMVAGQREGLPNAANANKVLEALVELPEGSVRIR